MGSPLALKDYFYPHVSVAADPKCNPYSNDTKKEQKLSVKPNISKAEDGDEYQISLDISVSAGDGGCSPYTIELLVIGIFQVAEGHDDVEKLLYVNGSGILYSAAREYIITITSRGPWPALVLPVYNFLKKYNMSMATAEDNEESEKEGGSE